MPEHLESDAVLFLIGTEGDFDVSDSKIMHTALWLKHSIQPKHTVICVCSGSLLAALSGLLKNKRCTTHHTHYDDLHRIEPSAIIEHNCLFVKNGNLLTSAGVTAGLDVTLHFIEKAAGAHCAATVAQHMVVYARRASQDCQDSTPSALLSHRNHLHTAIHRVQNAVLAHPEKPWRNAEMAELACVSPRHLTRLFKQETGILPHRYVQHIRVALATQLQSKEFFSQEELAYRVGFNSAQQLSRAIKKAMVQV